MKGLVTSWYERRQTGANLDPATAAPNIPFKGPDDRLESVHGADQSKVVENTDDAPWKPLVCLEIYAGSESLVGSGVLIAPNVILTAGHNHYRLATGKFANVIAASVGMKNGRQAAKARVVRVECCPNYTSRANPEDRSRFQYDYGIARLADDTLFQWAKDKMDVASQAPLNDSDLSRSLLTIAGYPFIPGKPLTLKSCTGKAVAGRIEPVNVWYDMDSMPGQSGGPVFRYDGPGKPPVFAGIHVAGDTKDNRARRFDTTMRTQVQAWLSSASGGQNIGV
jgi:V8-like Glu-specific endopeptidase